ncbi:DUF4396 domain-containing protein [Frateuria terrea]|uniref:DUF4396 domain-containing protein n=1 Tax=Frateuria terrea TaxID=529704 RepID=A0A1H6R0C7_9GAMM|nr:DUF4396 domain-containing protein [Frateuria terrea]SEI45190.1 protein of unknown function [Frateuria terrea]SFP10916.1 protein of unknown function [Frateuria terrea]
MLVLGGACAIGIGISVVRRPERMAIMNVVWPICALFGSVLVVAAYAKLATPRQKVGRPEPPFAAVVAKGALHCGSGCTLGDLMAEWLAFAAPVVATWFGWHWLFAEKTFAVWVLDFVFAFLLGIVFQYFAIAPMRGLSFRKGMAAAVKADALSLVAWQVGMYGGMALVQFGLYRHAYGHIAAVDTPEFWFAMQLAMLGGFATAYPVNWWLIRSHLKEAM